MIEQPAGCAKGGVLAWLRERRRLPVSTYRVQFHRGFTFSDAAALVPYLSALGVTDWYSSPYLKATPGSLHGYDVSDHRELSPELGTAADYDAFTAALAAHEMGQLADFVPNHMGVDPRTNQWWRSVLENGPCSPYAEFFDIDWDPIKPELKNKVLLPILDDQYGAVLERGDLKLRFEEGALQLVYLDRCLPVDPRWSPEVFGYGLEALGAGLGDQHPDMLELLSILTALQNLPSSTEREPARVAERQREKEVARARLARLAGASPAIAAHIERATDAFNGTPGVASSFDLLHRLLEGQSYRLAYWRTATDEINYRRFFDINELAGLRVENPRVFAAIHPLLLRLIREGKVTGVRVDHPDGLFDPAGYFNHLQEAALLAIAEDLPAALCPPERRSETLQQWRQAGDEEILLRPVYVVAEKVLSPGETLQLSWAVHGTTGYNFLNEVNGLFVDAANAARLRRTYATFTGRRAPFRDVLHDAKRLVIASAMGSEFTVLAHAIDRLSERSRRCRDFTLSSFGRILLELVACLPVYRTYVSAAGAGGSDVAAIGQAIAEARARSPALESSIFEFLRAILVPAGPEGQSAGADGLPFADRLEFAMRLQQYTGSVQAKGLEDTAFYRYNLLLSLNEVGGTPQRAGRSVEEFHAANRARLFQRPFEMLATTTHDTKRGEDARARLNALSEVSDEWRRVVPRWARLNARYRTIVDGAPAPDRNDEYLFYQSLVAVWPPEPPDAPLPVEAPADLVDRLLAYMRKAIKEAKVHTSWINENRDYDAAVAGFVEETLRGHGAARFLTSFIPFQRAVARLGMVNSLAQLVLKLASPGVADFYQGSELWELSLVDPDNRRAVDFDRRRDLFASVMPWLERSAGVYAGRCDQDAANTDPDWAPAVQEWLERWDDGRIKLFITACGLRLRRHKRDVFFRGDYVPLPTTGPSANRLVAFGRVCGSELLVAVAPRLTAPLVAPDRPLPLGADAWTTTRITMPGDLGPRTLRDVITGREVRVTGEAAGSWLAASDALSVCPVALLWGVRSGPAGPTAGEEPS